MKNTDQTEPTKWERYAKGKCPSMKRRSDFNDYTDRGIYMITMAIEGRRPLLGRMEGNPDANEGSDKPHVVLTELGRRVRECWMMIPRFYPQIEVMRLCLMPDHLHGMLFVHERMERHLGHVINGFKTGCRKAAKELGIITTAVPQSTPSPDSNHDGLRDATPRHPAHGMLWEPNYNDRILTGKGQLQRMLVYLDDNPRRLLLKRRHPEFFTQLADITIHGTTYQAMGNRFLLDNPIKRQVQCSRHLYQHEIDERIRTALDDGRRGAILVSPCISPGEKQIATAALHAHIPLIVLLLKGFPPYFKPLPHYLEACSEGRLLMLSPFPWQNEKLENMRQRCFQLNALAAAIYER